MAGQRQCLIQGELRAEQEARLGAFDRGFLYADGLFETFRTHRGRAVILDRHLERLARSAEHLGLALPPLDLQRDVTRLLAANNLADGIFRLTISRGVAGAGPRPPAGEPSTTCLLAVRPLRPDLERRAREGVVGWRLDHPARARGLALFRHKTLAYLPNVLALQNAPEGAEPLLENTAGELAEGATTNLFWLRAGTLYTPDEDAGCLPGVTRQVILEEARSAGYPIVAGAFPWRHLEGADEAFLTNAVIGVNPLVRVADTAVGDGRPGPHTLRLAALYRARIGQPSGGG